MQEHLLSITEVNAFKSFTTISLYCNFKTIFKETIRYGIPLKGSSQHVQKLKRYKILHSAGLTRSKRTLRKSLIFSDDRIVLRFTYSHDADVHISIVGHHRKHVWSNSMYTLHINTLHITVDLAFSFINNFNYYIVLIRVCENDLKLLKC